MKGLPMRKMRESAGITAVLRRFLVLLPALAVFALASSPASADSEGGAKNTGAALTTMARVGTSNDGGFPLADKVVVEKAKRKLYLMKDGEAFRTFDIALGIAPLGHKQ